MTASGSSPTDCGSRCGADVVLLVLLLLAVYTSVPFAVGGRTVPSATAFLLGAVSAFRLRGQLPDEELSELRLLLVLAGVFGCVQVTFGLEPLDVVDSMLLFFGAVALGYVVFAWIRRTITTPDRLLLLIQAALALLLIGALLEWLTPAVRALSDGFRTAVFPEDSIYTSDRRDLALHGGIRPKLFTSEPSHLAKFILLLLVGWCLIDPRESKWPAVGAAWLIAFAAIRSPSLLLLGPAILAIAMLHPVARIRRGTLVAAVVSCTVLAVTALAVTSQVPAQARLAAILSGSDPSFDQRVLGPARLTLEAWELRPVAGLGVGSLRGLEDVTASFAIAGDQATVEELSSVGSAFFDHWISFGLLGGLAVAFALYRLARACTGPGAPLTLALAVLFGMAQGGYNGPRFWFFVFFTMACLWAVCPSGKECPDASKDGTHGQLSTNV